MGDAPARTKLAFSMYFCVVTLNIFVQAEIVRFVTLYKKNINEISERLSCLKRATKSVQKYKPHVMGLYVLAVAHVLEGSMDGLCGGMIRTTRQAV